VALPSSPPRAATWPFPPHHPVLPRGPSLLTTPCCHVALPSSPPRAATWPPLLTTACCHVASPPHHVASPPHHRVLPRGRCSPSWSTWTSSTRSSRRPGRRRASARRSLRRWTRTRRHGLSTERGDVGRLRVHSLGWSRGRCDALPSDGPVVDAMLCPLMVPWSMRVRADDTRVRLRRHQPRRHDVCEGGHALPALDRERAGDVLQEESGRPARL
jgi:hypothetical protein